MNVFKAVGIIDGETETIEYSWKDGHGSIEGDPMIMLMMKCALEKDTPIGPVGQYMDRDIDEPLAVLFMMRECFDTIISCEGDVPQAADIPDDVIC